MRRDQATAARPHIDVPSPVNGDEDAILAHIYTPAVCLDGVCACVRVCCSQINRLAFDCSEY